MAVLIPIDVQDMPIVPTIDMEKFRSIVSSYATSLYYKMAKNSNTHRKSRNAMISDDQLSQILSSFPEQTHNKDLDTLTKEDYNNFIRTHHSIKGIEKWLQ